VVAIAYVFREGFGDETIEKFAGYVGWLHRAKIDGGLQLANWKYIKTSINYVLWDEPFSKKFYL
jgi:hypothetical protein